MMGWKAVAYPHDSPPKNDSYCARAGEKAASTATKARNALKAQGFVLFFFIALKSLLIVRVRRRAAEEQSRERELLRAVVTID